MKVYFFVHASTSDGINEDIEPTRAFKSHEEAVSAFMDYVAGIKENLCSARFAGVSPAEEKTHAETRRMFAKF